MKAGLPEIYAFYNAMWNWVSGSTVGGALKHLGGNEASGSGKGRISNTNWDFLASRYNSIYGNSSTVTPLSVKVFFFIKY